MIGKEAVLTHSRQDKGVLGIPVVCAVTLFWLCVDKIAEPSCFVSLFCMVTKRPRLTVLWELLVQQDGSEAWRSGSGQLLATAMPS